MGKMLFAGGRDNHGIVTWMECRMLREMYSIPCHLMCICGCVPFPRKTGDTAWCRYIALASVLSGDHNFLVYLQQYAYTQAYMRK